jgi:hypothetical protein
MKPNKRHVRDAMLSAWRILSNCDREFPFLERCDERSILSDAERLLSGAIAEIDALIVADDDKQYAEEHKARQAGPKKI